jgi:hypothetical protein
MTQKVYFSSLLWHNNVSCLFSSCLLIKSGDNWALIKVDWLVACIALRRVVDGRCIGRFPPANGKQRKERRKEGKKERRKLSTCMN